MSNHVVIVGAGVIGAASALALLKDGHKVTLVDKERPCAGASFGNAGAIVNGSCAPTAMPGIMFDAVRMLAHANSPFSIKPSYLAKITPWLFRFILQSRSSAVFKNAKHLHALSQHAVESWYQLTNNTQLTSLFRETGWLKVYELEKTFAETLKARELFDANETNYELLTASQIHDLEPNLATVFKRGFYQKDSLSITNPERLVEGIVDLFVSRGGTYKRFDVGRITTNDNQVTLRGSCGEMTANRVVIAAGAWSRSLAKQLRDNIPLDTERGYHLMLPKSNSSLLSRPVVHGENSFVLSPMETGLRMTSQVEFAGLNAPPDYKKIRSLLPLVKKMLPKAETREESVWLGFRPSLPDSLPVLGFSSKTNKVIYAFGHQHLGLTLGAITGFLISDLLSNRTPRIPIFPYRPNRFNQL